MPKKIYLVEDDPAIIDIYATMIRKADIDLEVISLGADVMRRLEAAGRSEGRQPDLVLLDLILPDMNGMEILADMKKSDYTKNIAVFILSNQADVSFERAEIKPDKFIVKADTTPTQLLDIVKKQLHLS